MKKIFIVGILLGIPSAYTVFGSECEIRDKGVNVTRFSKFRVEYNAERGETIYYPEKYKTYQDYKENYLEKEYVTILLTKRLKMLVDFSKKVLNEESAKINYVYHKVLFENNEMQLITNAPKSVLGDIEFDINYSSYEDLTNHSIKIAALLKERLEKSLQEVPQKRKQEKMRSLIAKISGFIEQNTKGQDADGQQLIGQEKTIETIQESMNGLEQETSGKHKGVPSSAEIYAVMAAREPMSAFKNSPQRSEEYKVATILPLSSGRTGSEERK